MILGYQHYVRIDEYKKVTHAFSSAFDNPENGDILINGNAERHFPLNILGADGSPIYELVNVEIIRIIDTK